jgi:hypothetical protein
MPILPLHLLLLPSNYTRRFESKNRLSVLRVLEPERVSQQVELQVLQYLLQQVPMPLV